MAYAEVSRIPVRMTWTEHAALWVSARLADLVAWRVQRRRMQIERFVARRHTRTVLAAEHEEGLRRALSLGLMR